MYPRTVDSNCLNPVSFKVRVLPRKSGQADGPTVGGHRRVPLRREIYGLPRPRRVQLGRGLAKVRRLRPHLRRVSVALGAPQSEVSKHKSWVPNLRVLSIYWKQEY